MVMKKILPLILLILISAAVICGQKTFENKKFGFSMHEPENWMVANSEEIKKNLENFDISEEKLEEMWKTAKGSILLTAYYKYDPEKKAGLIPKIQIDIRPNPTKNFQHFKTSITKSVENFKKYFEAYEFIQEPKEIVVSGINSVFSISKFTIKSMDGQEIKVRARVYAIPYKNYFFQVNLVDGQVEEDNSKLFDELVKTIKIGK
jgi:hypothetical protein